MSVPTQRSRLALSNKVSFEPRELSARTLGRRSLPKRYRSFADCFGLVSCLLIFDGSDEGGGEMSNEDGIVLIFMQRLGFGT